MITKQYLTNLKKISKIFDNGMPFESFSITDKTHVSLLKVVTNNRYGNRKYLFSELPNVFINKENIVVTKECGIEINGIMLYVDTECSAETYDKKPPNIKWGEVRYTDAVIDGKILKGMISLNGDYKLSFVCDEKSARVEAQIMHRVPRVSYTVGKGSDIPYESNLEFWAIRQYKSIIPDGPIKVRFADDYPVVFEWEDDMENEYMLMIAPCIER